MDSLQKIILVIALSLATTSIHSTNTQNLDGEDVDAGAYYNYNSISAQVADMFRYGEFQTSLFTGRMQQTIPIYTLDDPDFNMNIALHYNAEGFKPRKHSGPVGYNWFLEAGGCITREVKGFPDEIYGREVNNITGIEGMYHFITQNPDANNVSMNDVFNLPFAPDTQACGTNLLWHNIGDSCDYRIDYLPDVFHFDFLGYKGTCMINNSGKVQIISGDYVDVDLSGILTDWNSVPLPPIPEYPKENSTITIKTADGYTYIFGGDLSKLEYTINAYSYNFFLPPSPADSRTTNPATVSTWHLAKIIAPNQRTVTFYYKSASNIYSATYPYIPEDAPEQDSPLWEFNECFDRYGWYYNQERSIYWQIFNNNSSSFISPPYTDEEYSCLLKFYSPPYVYLGNTFYTYSATKSCILDSICVSGTHPLRIIFDNSQEERAMYDYYDHYKHNIHLNYQLDSVRVLSSNNAIKKAHLSYDYNGYYCNSYNFNWRFLDTIYISGVGTYRLEYNDGYYPDLYSSSYTYAIYYNHILGESHETDDYGYYVGSCDVALLRKMTYPTGGYQIYSYSPYKYNKKRSFSMTTDSYVEMNTANVSGPATTKRGARISEIKTYDQNNHPIDTVSYSYSNGIFFDNLKVYNLEYGGFDLYPEYGWPIRHNANYGLLDTHIGYGKVTESVTNSQGNYKTIYQFDTGEDFYTSYNDENISERYYCENRNFGATEGHLLLYSGELRKWGKPISVEYYDSANRMLQSKHNSYNDLTFPPDSLLPYLTAQLGYIDTIVIFNCFRGAEISKKLYVLPDVLTQEITKDYNTNGDSIVTCHTYSHDQKLRLKRETVTDSEGIQRFTKYTYPDDIKLNIGMSQPSQWPGLYLMQLGHQINKPIEIVSGYIGENNTDYITLGAINLYATGTYLNPLGNNLPSLVIPRDTVIIPNVDSLIPPGFIAGYYPYLYKTMSLPLATPISDYLPMGAAGTTVSYDSRYRLTCEYDFDLMYRPLTIKPFGKMATTYTWNGIYPATKTIGNQTWTYTHIPHVGVNSITDPRGITTYFTYDSAGRLIEEYQLNNGTKQILNAYKYHVKTE